MTGGECCSVVWSTRTLYHAAGMAAGLAEGLKLEATSELKAAFTVTGGAVHCILLAAQEATEELGEKMIVSAYVTAGACAGLVAGSKYALSNLKVWLLDDDVTLRLLNPSPSPIKYAFPPDFRINTRSLSRLSAGSKCSSRSSSVSPRAAAYGDLYMR